MPEFLIFGDPCVISEKNPVAITLGNFDGVHLGHKQFLQEIKKNAKGLDLVVVIFDPHPATYFHPTIPKKLLTLVEDRAQLLLKYGADVVVVQHFDEDFSNLSADAFVENWLLHHFNVGITALGYDFCYGKDRKGNFDHMSSCAQKYGFFATQLSAKYFSSEDKKPISSSTIRNLLLEGQPEKAHSLLGHPYFLTGPVIQGNQRGRLLGYPTANLRISPHVVVPKYGVYGCYVEILHSPVSSLPQEYLGKMFPGVMNCGIRPTVDAGAYLQLEAHIFNFNQDIYDAFVRFHIINFIRGEIKFPSLEALKHQIAQDAQIAKDTLQ